MSCWFCRFVTTVKDNVYLRDNRWGFVSSLKESVEESLLVGIIPGADRKFSDLDLVGTNHWYLTTEHVSEFAAALYRTSEVFVEWHHWFRFTTVEHSVEILNDLTRIVIGNFRHPSGTDTIGTIYQYHWDNRQIMNGFDLLIVVVFVLQERLVMLVKYESRKWAVNCYNCDILVSFLIIRGCIIACALMFLIKSLITTLVSLFKFQMRKRIVNIRVSEHLFYIKIMTKMFWEIGINKIVL